MWEGLALEDILAVWSILRPFGTFCGHMVYFMVIWYIVPVLVCCTKKNLAALDVYGFNCTLGHFYTQQNQRK
jgi:hypothetical protein